MSEAIKHECGIALIRLLKPLQYYKDKYNSTSYGLDKICLLMEKQHNRGQDGAGLAALKVHQEPGQEYLFRQRSNQTNPIIDVFSKIHQTLNEHTQGGDIDINDHATPFIAELYLGHLRYGTFGKNDIQYCHPVIKQNNWRSRNLALAGNFNMTNVDEIFKQLTELGQHPRNYTDTVTVLEKIGHFLDEENYSLDHLYTSQGHGKRKTAELIASNLNIPDILARSSKHWDGGYAIAGLIGHGDAFTMRDPWGIRPAYYFVNDEVAVVASERSVIQTVFNQPQKNIHELEPGTAIIIKKDGKVNIHRILPAQEKKACSFEHIYFSRGNDAQIYSERKKLGELLAPPILKAINNDLENTIFSHIPNTATTAFIGLTNGIQQHLNAWKIEAIKQLDNKKDDKQVANILNQNIRIENMAVKDVKMRTFITNDSSRNEMVSHVYDVTYGVVKDQKDSLVMLDDSIVRGTTLKNSILQILDRLHPKKIIIVSSAPQIRYPDCYGIDMSKIGDFCAFAAAIELLKEQQQQHIIDETYERCKEELTKPVHHMVNCVKAIYAPFSDEQISEKIAQILKPSHLNAEVQIIYNTVENLAKACPNNRGDWFFTGDYPTPGGNKVVNKTFVNYIEGISTRAY